MPKETLTTKTYAVCVLVAFASGYSLGMAFLYFGLHMSLWSAFATIYVVTDLGSFVIQSIREKGFWR